MPEASHHFYLSPNPTEQLKEQSKFPKQEVRDDLVVRLMAKIRGQFCGNMTPKDWAQMCGWIRLNVVLWPAQFITKRHFTIPGEKYEKIMLEIFEGIKRHGTQGVVKRWPGYLMKCVQSHFETHWETYYHEAKGVQNLALHTLANIGKVTPQDRTVESLSMAHQVLSATAKKQKQIAVKKSSDNDQLTMF